MPLEFMTLSLLKKIVSEHPVTYRYFISDELKKTIDASIPKCLKNAKVKVSLATKLYWLFNDIKSFDDDRAHCKCCRKIYDDRNIKYKNFSQLYKTIF